MSSARQEIQSILYNPKFHHRFHNSPPPVPMLRWTNPFTSPLTHFFKIHFNIIVSSTSRSSKWSFSLRSPNQDPACTSPVSHTCHKLRLSHYSRLYQPNNNWWSGQIM